MRGFWEHAFCRDTVGRSARVALVVGTLLGVINHFDMFLTGNFTTRRVIQLLLTYIVPYGVATYAAAMQARAGEASTCGEGGDSPPISGERHG